MDVLAGFHMDALLGLAVLALLIYSKVEALRARKAAVEVEATVLKVMPHSRMTAYFVRYVFQGEERIAELRCAPMRRAHEVGSVVRVLIDPQNPPDEELPEDGASAANAAIDGGSCTLVGAPLFSWWDLLYLAASLTLVYRSFGGAW
jgi:hypothetical protein